MILEGIVTTVGPDGAVNIAPMGPLTDEQVSTLVFRPFQTSTTYRNLVHARAGVFHVTDDVGLIARAALSPGVSAPLERARKIGGMRLTDCCRWFEFEVREIDDREPRTTITVEIVHRETCRDFYGFVRAKHAVLEATILATRLHLIDRSEVERSIGALRPLVEKTAGSQEADAFAFVEAYIREWHGKPTE